MVNNLADISFKDADWIIENTKVDWLLFKDKSILITGASGLFGRTLASSFNLLNKKKELNIQIYLLSSSPIKLKSIFGRGLEDFALVEEKDLEDIESLSYIFHCASPTDSTFFVEKPVETIESIISMTQTLLQLAKKNDSEFLLLSTMEVYGTGAEKKISEEDTCLLNYQTMRASYPEAKRLAELLSFAYFEEYRVKTKVVRLVQTLGVPFSFQADKRLAISLLDCLYLKKTIKLKTTCLSKRPYVYIRDAVSALFFITLKGTNGKAYNVSNPATFMSVKNFVGLLKEKLLLQTEFNIEQDIEKTEFTPIHKINLDTSKLSKLGWEPRYDIIKSYEEMLLELKEGSR